MGYIGKIPSAVPLTSADITDNVITSAKIVDGTITNTDIASSIITGQTAETSIAGGDSILIYDDSATALRKMTRTNFVAGIGGSNTPSFMVYKTADQTINDFTQTKITFDSERFDTDNAFDNSTNYRFTVPSGQGGKYFIYGASCFSGAQELYRTTVSIYKNGSIYHTAFGHNAFSNTAYSDGAYIGAIIDLAATDYVELYTLADTNDGSTANLDVDNVDGATYPVFFGGFKLI